jgi:hypothetical protein
MDSGNRLSEFIKGVAAASQLLSRATKNGYFIEAICLASNLIDAQLRIGLVLQHQINTKSSDIPIELIHQKSNSKKYSEREIFKLSKRTILLMKLYLKS